MTPYNAMFSFQLFLIRLQNMMSRWTMVGGLFITYNTHIPGSLHQTEKSAGLEKGHHCHTAHRLFHWLHWTYVPGWGQLTAWPTPITLCTAPMEQAEGDEQAEARPHPGSASSLPQMAKKRERWGGRCGGGTEGGQEEEITLEIGQQLNIRKW